MRSKPSDYREQSGCHDCAHVFRRFEYDDGPSWFCTLNAPKRPPCMSVAMGEISPEYIRDDPGYDLWDKWSEGREVQSFGICSQWQQVPPPLPKKSP